MTHPAEAGLSGKFRDECRLRLRHFGEKEQDTHDLLYRDDQFDGLSSEFGKTLRIRAHRSKDLRSLGYNGVMGLAVGVFWLTVFSLCCSNLLLDFIVPSGIRLELAWSYDSTDGNDGVLPGIVASSYAALALDGSLGQEVGHSGDAKIPCPYRARFCFGIVPRAALCMPSHAIADRWAGLHCPYRANLYALRSINLSLLDLTF